CTWPAVLEDLTALKGTFKSDLTKLGVAHPQVERAQVASERRIGLRGQFEQRPQATPLCGFVQADDILLLLNGCKAGVPLEAEGHLFHQRPLGHWNEDRSLSHYGKFLMYSSGM